jgi:adenosylmethionine-8-amino-7-oxononanoate aminotransferase
MSVGDRSIFTKPFNSFLFDVDFIDFPNEKNQNEVLEQFKRLIVAGDVCAFIFEPLVQGAAGMRLYSASFLDTLIEDAQQHNVICIADEVFTGFGRTGKYFASDHLTNKPDIMCLSKGLTGGTLPMGITSCSQQIVSAFETNDFYKTFFHGHSYTANPLACAAANASFKLLIDPVCEQNIKRISSNHRLFKDEVNNSKKLKDIRILGTILALELNRGESSYANDLRKKIYHYFLQRDILLRPLGNVIYLVPPYIIQDEELRRIYDAIKEFLDNEIK